MYGIHAIANKIGREGGEAITEILEIIMKEQDEKTRARLIEESVIVNDYPNLSLICSFCS